MIGNPSTLFSVLGLVTILIAYFPTVAISGYYQAWFAKKLGDDTAYQLGYQTIDPLVHTSLLGLGLLIYSQLMSGFGFGWGRRIPLNLENIDMPYQDIKRILLFYSGAIVHTALLVSIIVIGGVVEAFNIIPTGAGIILHLYQVVLMFNVYLLVLFLILGSIEFFIVEYLHSWNLFEKYGMVIQIGVFIAAFMIVSLVFPFLLSIVFTGVNIVSYAVDSFIVMFKGS